ANGIPFDTGGLIVTWSLAIEGQFYLVWPVVVALASRRALARICVAGVVVAVACRWGLTRVGADYWFAYVLTPCRMDGVLIGAAVALAATAGTPRAVFVRRAWLGLAAAVAALAAVVVANERPHVHGRAVTILGYTCAGLVSAGVLALVSAGRPRWWFLLNSRPLRAVGERGYAVYLVHVPIILVGYVVFRSAPVRAALIPACEAARCSGPMYVCFFGFVVGVSMLLAWGCWVAIERPCLGLKRHFPHGSGRRETGCHQHDPRSG
ncbi:MAG TPA: acyltransferase family protein, partial [Urbifossiella sp.]|nr:acyltransferase family protein [Urbifossiella sp.]